MPVDDNPAIGVTPPRPPASEPKGCSNFRLHALMRRLDQLYDAELAKVGLRTTQYSLLSHVVRLGPMRPGELAQAMRLQPSSVTRNLQSLIAAGWVEQGAGSDARSRSVSATAAGREKRGVAQRRWKAAQLALNEALGADRVVELHAMLDQCLVALDAAGTTEPQESEHG